MALMTPRKGSILFAEVSKSRFLIRVFTWMFALALVIPSPAEALNTSPSIDMSKYTLPDGSLPVICFGDGNTQGKADIHCDECLSASAPSADQTTKPSTIYPDRSAALKAGRTLSADLAGTFRAENPARAPPVS